MRCIFLSFLFFAGGITIPNCIHAQQRFDLKQLPSTTLTNEKASNASLLRTSTIQKPDSTMLHPKGMQSPVYTGKGMNNEQLLNMQKTEYKVGNTKATSTIYYDESGRIKGNSTMIGGK